MNIKLSICIPTYNRLNDLKGCLEFLLPQVAEISAGQVEIVIIDNASTDGTCEFIDRLPTTHSFIRVFHNPTNLGFDGNSAKCIEYAAGEYTALLSDDDRYLAGQVTAILNVITQRDYALVALNYYSFITKVERLYQTYAPEDDVVFEHARDLINYLTVGHFSGLVYKSKLAKQTLTMTLAREPLVGSGRARGIYFEVALRLAYSTNLPAYFIGRRRLAAKIPPTVDYDEIQNICVENCHFFSKLFDEGIISASDLDYRYSLVVQLLPQLIIRCTPSMSTSEIRRVMTELDGYLGSRAEFKSKSRLLFQAALFAPIRWLYRIVYGLARFSKRFVKREL